MKRWAVLFVVGLAVAATPATTFADDAASTRTASPSRIEDAREHFQLGKKFYEARDYAAAAEQFERAYALEPRPEFLVNVAQARRLNDEPERALESYRAFLKLEPDSEYADSVRDKIAQIEAQLTSQSASDELEPPTSVRASPQRVARRETSHVLRERGQVQADSPGSRWSRWRTTGLVVVAVGAVSSGLSVKFALDARRLNRELSRHSGPWNDGLLAKEAQRRTARRTFYATAGVGGAAILTGLALFAFAPDRTEGSGVSVKLAPSSVHVAFTTGF